MPSKLPVDFVDRLAKIVPSARLSGVLKSFEQSPPTTFRVNRLKGDPETVARSLRDQGFRIERVAWMAEAFILTHGRLRDLQETDVYRDGLIYVQELSSMLPVWVLAPQPGETVLDLTAAPGSKTTQIAAQMQGQGRIVANDNNPVRFMKLSANLRLQGADFVEATRWDGESFGRRWPESFDRVLLDAPCSAEGRFETHDPRTLGYWKIRKVQEMARKQKRLIRSALRSLKVGGMLVYSTCTFSPEENEAVLDDLLRRAPGTVEVEPIRLPISAYQPALAAWEGKVYSDPVRHAVRVLPNGAMRGFFIARLRKVASFSLSNRVELR